MDIKTIKLDISKELFAIVKAKQGDIKSRFLLFNLYDNSIPFSLVNRTVRVYARKPDGQDVFNDLEIINSASGSCELELTNQLLAVPGMVNMELMIIEGEKKLTSIPFQLEVIESINSENAVISTNEFSSLVNALNKAEEYNQELKDASEGLETKYTERLNTLGSHLEQMTFLMKQPNIDTTGVNDCTSAVQSFFDMVANAGGGVVDIPKGTYSFDSTLQYYPNRITLRATKGVTFNFRMTSGVGMLIRPNISESFTFNQRHYILGIKFTSPNKLITLVKSEGTSDFKSSFWTFKNCIFENGSIGIDIYSHTWCVLFDTCTFKLSGNVGVNMLNGGVNYGERITLHGCTFDGCKLGIYNSNNSGDIKVSMCSIDYCGMSAKVEGGSIEITNSFVEANNANYGDDYWFVCNKGYMLLDNTKLTIQQDKTKELFFVKDFDNSTLYGQGLVLNGIIFVSAYYSLPFLVKGNGRCTYSNYITPLDSKRPLICRSENLVAYGECKNNLITTEVEQKSGYTLPIHDSVTNSLKFKATVNGENLGCSVVVDCNSNKDALLHLKLKSAIATSGKRITIEREFLDKNKNNIVKAKFPYLVRANFETDYEGFTTTYGVAGYSTRTNEKSAVGSYALKCVINDASTFSGRAMSFTQQAGKYYMIVSRVNMATWTSGGLRHEISGVGTSTQKLGEYNINGLTNGWAYMTLHWKALQDATISVYACASNGGNYTAYVDDVYIYCINDVLPNIDFTYADGILNYLFEITDNKMLITTDKNFETLKLNGNYLYAPSGTRYARYNILADNMDIASEFYINDIVINTI